jgi:integrase/recombinase XerD
MVLDARGRVGRTIEVRNAIAKYGTGRCVPLHPDLRSALEALRRKSGTSGPVIRSSRGGRMQANSIVNWFIAHFRRCGVKGCSSHSGRRTFITHAARRAGLLGASLRDVQMLAGHRSIETTQRYIEGDSDAQRRLVRAL